MNRRPARVLALQMLYAWTLRADESVDAVLSAISANFLNHGVEDSDEAVEAKDPSAERTELARYGRFIAGTVIEKVEEIDKLISDHTPNWNIERIAIVDKNLLRIAIAELMYSKEIAYRIVIDEAIQIAKEYGSNESGRFVNGVIDSIYRTLSK